MNLRRWLRGALVAAGPGSLVALSAPAAAAGQTDLQETLPLVQAMFYLSLAGALLTFVILVWALLKFRDPTTKGRRYG